MGSERELVPAPVVCENSIRWRTAISEKHTHTITAVKNKETSAVGRLGRFEKRGFVGIWFYSIIAY